MSKEYEFKSDYIKQLAENCKNANVRKDGIKEKNKINFSDIATYVKNAQGKSIEDLYADINSGAIKVGMDKDTIDMLIANKDNEKIKELINNTNIKMSIDVDGLKDLSSDKFNQIRSMGVNVDKIYVNSGWDVAAARGYTPDVYDAIINKAEYMYNGAMKKLPRNASEKDRFMALYNIVTKNAVYDHDALKHTSGDKFYTSRNLESFFLNDGSCVCAGTADVLKQLCEMNGIEAEYVQGDAQSHKMKYEEYHAWVRVKIDGVWFNADPTWDANKVKGKRGYCLKSDEDFEFANGKSEGHSLDRTYNPSYYRDANGRSVAERIYEAADYSIDSSRLESQYKVDEKGFRHLTEEEAAYTMANNIPAAAGTNIADMSVMEIIIQFILRIAGAPARAFENIKKKFQERKDKVDTNNIEKFVKEELAKEESFEESIHVDNKDANKYKNSAEKNQNEQNKEDNEKNDITR